MQCGFVLCVGNPQIARHLHSPVIYITDTGGPGGPGGPLISQDIHFVRISVIIIVIYIINFLQFISGKERDQAIFSAILCPGIYYVDIFTPVQW